MKKKLWDGQGVDPSEIWDGEYFTSYKSDAGYISRYAEKNASSEELPDPTDYTGEPCGSSWRTKYKDGDVFSIFTESYSIIIEDRVKVVDNKLTVLETTQLV